MSKGIKNLSPEQVPNNNVVDDSIIVTEVPPTVQNSINVSDLKSGAYYLTLRPLTLELWTKYGKVSYPLMRYPAEQEGVLTLSAGAVFHVAGKHSLDSKLVYRFGFNVSQTNATHKGVGQQHRFIFQENLRNEGLRKPTKEEVYAYYLGQ